MKKYWLLIAGIAVGEALSWTLFNAPDYDWIASIVGAVAAMIFAGMLIHNIRKAQTKRTVKWLTYILCAAVIAGQLYGWAWMHSAVTWPANRVQVVEMEKTHNDKYRVSIRIGSDAKLYKVLFSAEDAALLGSVPSGTYNVFVHSYNLWPQHATGGHLERNQNS